LPVFTVVENLVCGSGDVDEVVGREVIKQARI
jgi:hypothetical protein